MEQLHWNINSYLGAWPSHPPRFHLFTSKKHIHSCDKSADFSLSAVQSTTYLAGPGLRWRRLGRSSVRRWRHLSGGGTRSVHLGRHGGRRAGGAGVVATGGLAPTRLSLQRHGGRSVKHTHADTPEQRTHHHQVSELSPDHTPTLKAWY